MTLATTLAATAERLLTAYGESVSFSRKVEGAYSVTDGTTAASTDTTFTGYGAPMAYKASEVDGALIQQDDTKLMLETGTAPLVGDVATLNSVAYRVMNVIASRCNRTDVVYTLQLRR